MAARRTGSTDRSKEQREFVSEAEEILERMQTDLADLADQQGSGGRLDPDLINSLFRSAHSLKGLSGMFGRDELGLLSHRLEDILDGLRMGRVSLDDEGLRLLDESVGTLASHLERVDDAAAEVVADLARRIDEWRQAPELPTADLSELDIDSAMLRALTEYEEHRLKENLRIGLEIHVIESSFDLMAFEEGLAELTQAIREVGEVLSTLPSPGETPDSQIRFALLTATSLDAATLCSRLGLPARAVHSVVRRQDVAALPGPAESEVRRSSPASVPAPGEAPPGEIGSLKSVSETVRVDIGKLDDLMNLVGELVIQRSAIGKIAGQLRSDPETAAIGGELEKVHKRLERQLQDLQAGVLEVRMVPLRQVFEKLSRVVRRMRRDTAKEVEFKIRGGATELDKLIVEELVDPLMHIVRNAFDHALESPDERRAAGKNPEGCISVEASQRGNDVVVAVSDDGRGIDAEKVYRRAIDRGIVDAEAVLTQREKLELVFAPGLSTRSEVTETSGRGVGMDVVRSNITNLGGIVDISTTLGRGTSITLTLPITLAIIQALVVGVAEQRFAVPLGSVRETMLLDPSEIQRSDGRELLNLRGEAVPLRRLAQEFGISGADSEAKGYAVLVGVGEARLGLLVDRLEGQQDAVIKPIHGPVESIRGIAGATELGDLGAVLVLDVSALVEDAGRRRDAA